MRRFAVSERADVFCCGMTIAQAATLETLRLEGALRMGDLGRRLGIAPSTLTRNLQRLLDMGRGSVLVVFDVRRYQADVIEFARGADRRGATVVLLTDTWQSPAARAADHVLGFPVGSPSVFDVLTLGMALAEALVGAVALRLGDAARERIAALEELRDPFGPDSREDQR